MYLALLGSFQSASQRERENGIQTRTIHAADTSGQAAKYKGINEDDRGRFNAVIIALLFDGSDSVDTRFGR